MNNFQAHSGPDDAGVWEHLLPDSTWEGLANELREMVDDLLSAEMLRGRGYFEPALVHQMIA
jgi:hypothetical protein